MPLIIPKDLPAYEELQQENVFVMHQERAMSQHIRPLRILILNLMPTKIVTETQLARLLANSPLQVQVTFLQTATHSTTHTAPPCATQASSRCSLSAWDGISKSGAVGKGRYDPADFSELVGTDAHHRPLQRKNSAKAA